MKHVFAISAYGESPFLEDCIASLENQTSPGEIILCTSTPSAYLEKTAAAHSLPYFVRDGASSLKDDWNFCARKAEETGAELLTIAHQDDVYLPDYAKNVQKAYIEANRPKKDRNGDAPARKVSLIFTAAENIDGMGNAVDPKAEKVKRLLRWPLTTDLKNTKAGRRLSLAFGNSIPCPACTYVLRAGTENGAEPAETGAAGNAQNTEFFASDCRFVIDWKKLAELAQSDGSFEYVKEPGIRIRLHEGQETARTMRDDTRKREELEMFEQFHTKPVAKLLMKFYEKSSDIYGK